MKNYYGKSICLSEMDILYIETVLPADIKENLYLCFRSNRQDMEIYYGDKMGIWSFLFKERGGEFVIAILMFLMGMASVAAGLILCIIYCKSVELVYLGCGVTFAACWMISDSVFRQLIFPNVSIINDLAFVMVMMLPFPFLIYMNEVQKRRYNKFYVLVCSAVAIDTIVCITLQCLNILDFSDSITLFAMFCGLAVLLIVITVVADCIRGNIRMYKWEAMGIAGAALTAILQLLLYFDRIANSSSMAIASGMIILLIISSINTIKNILSIEKEKQHAIYANEAKAKFLANVSHEIRTPINAGKTLLSLTKKNLY